MEPARKTLSLKPAVALGDVSDAGEIVRRAIVMKLCIMAVYNKTLVKLAPHILYTRHDEPFVDGVVMERDGKAPREIKLGVFKLVGLKDLRLTPLPFQPMAGFDAKAPLYLDTTIQTVQA